jgi:hypothetical protein
MNISRVLFDIGFLCISLFWKDKSENSQAYNYVNEELLSELKKIKLNSKFISIIEKEYSVGLIRSQCGIAWIETNLVKKIQKKYQKRGSACFQVGLYLSDIVFYCCMINPSNADRAKYSLLMKIDKFKNTLFEIGSIDVAYELIERIENALENPIKIHELQDICNNGGVHKQKVGFEIEKNVVIDKPIIYFLFGKSF